MPVPTEDQLTQQTMKHWQQWLPELARQLQAQGTLEETARDAAQETLEQVRLAETRGAHPLEAYLALKQEWCFLPSEERQSQS